MKSIFAMGFLFLGVQQSWASVPVQGKIIAENFSVVVAVIDTGIDIEHKDLKDVIWRNEGESGIDQLGRNKESNGIDDDGNGFVDDVHGWNFVDQSNRVFDDHGHGTHVAGLISKSFLSEKRKGPSVSVRRTDLKLMVLKYYSSKSKSSDNLLNSIRAIQYANRMGAQVINYSGGGASKSTVELEALLDTQKKGITVVAAAGNNQMDSDVFPFYPASYRLSNIISVAATDDRGELGSFSNYGPNTVDVAAPGKWIWSTLPNNSYGALSGTSQATGTVCGVVAYLLMVSPRETTRVILQRLLDQGRVRMELKGKTKYQIALSANLN